MSQMMISTERLTKVYGTRPVVSDLDLRVPTGCVYGFLGPNGSGKSTTMKMLLSLVRPTSGRIEIMGRQVQRATRTEVMTEIGSLIETPPAYAHLTGAENLAIVGRLLRLRSDQVERAVRTVRLEQHLDRRVRSYSLGMKQRLGIAMALAREPRLLVLDEPTNGLDPAGIEEIRGLLQTLAGRGVTVLVSSHLLGEIDRVATVLGILAGGRLLFQGSREELFARSTPDVLIDTPEPERAARLCADWAARREDDGVRVPGIDHATTARVVAHLVGAGVALHQVRREEQSLEDVFMDLTGRGAL